MAFKKLPVKPSSNTGAWGFVGEEALKQASKVQREAQERSKRSPFRFFIAPGSSAEVVILDESFRNHAFAIFEHEIQNPADKKDRRYEVSLKTINNHEDPLETLPVVYGATSKPYFVMFLTVLHLNVVKADGTVMPYSRKLLPIKGKAQFEAFEKLSDNAIKKYGSLRGLHLKMTRTNDQKSPRIGVPGTLDTMEYGFFTEAELAARFGHEPIISKVNQKIIVPKNGNIQPFNYMDVFEKPSIEDVRQRYNIQPPLGSADKGNVLDNAESWDSATDDLEYDVVEDDDIPY